MRRGVVNGLTIAVVALMVPAVASAHVERAAYWPDPKPDCSITPCAGGEFPKAKSLSSALSKKARRRTHIVCQADSLTRLKASIAAARANGYDIRPHDHRTLSKAQAKKLLAINKRLFKRCRHHEIQRAVTVSHNNARVVIMPGLYTEPTASAKKTNDPDCAKYKVSNGNEAGAASYAYQFHCPNDANMIAIIGRQLGKEDPPSPPRWERFGIPDEGACIRCNMQMEGSGVSADDVIIEAGDAKDANSGPNGVHARKDVALRADRADGFILRNVTVRHAREHGIYVIETDGHLLDRFKAFYNGGYGTLTFADDHGITENCEAVGHGDSGVYPGAPVDTGEQRQEGTSFRINTEVRYCDLHHNEAGYSATNGNAVRIHHNNLYDNSLGFNTDIATAPGHPGFPDDSMIIEDNNIFSNNFNAEAPDSDVHPFFPYPVGTGMWIAGGNAHTVRRNRIYDNWRRGTMLFSIPDAIICGPASNNTQHGCDPNQITTSYRNRYYDNIMGVAPDGRAAPNGTDFWWDSFPGNTDNCWYKNTGAKAISTSPSSLPNCADGTDSSSSVGTGDLSATGELYYCGAGFALGTDDLPNCPWHSTPPKPGSAAAREQEAESRRAFARSFTAYCQQFGELPTCKPFAALLRR